MCRELTKKPKAEMQADVFMAALMPQKYQNMLALSFK